MPRSLLTPLMFYSFLSRSGWSYRTGYLIRALPGGGTELFYCTLSDPKGWIPAWVLNAAVSVTGPKVVQKLLEVRITNLSL